MKVECDDWYDRNLGAKQRDYNLRCINADKRLALVEEELQEQSKELAEIKQEQSKELAEIKQEQSKEFAEIKQENRKMKAETNKKFTENRKALEETNNKYMELEQEQSNLLTQNMWGKY